MRRSRRLRALLTLCGLLASLAVFIPSGIANAAESMPALQWPAVSISNPVQDVVTSPNGNVTVPCVVGAGNNLTTYNASGQVVQTLPHT